MPLKTRGEPAFTASAVRFICYSLGRIYLQDPHLELVVPLPPTVPPPPPPLLRCYNWERRESNSPVVKQQQTGHRFQRAWIWLKGRAEAKSGAGAETNCS